MLDHRVAEFPTRSEHTRQMQHSVYVEDAAEYLYELAAMCDRLGERPPAWHQLPASEKARYRFEVIGALNRLEPARRYEAQLRAREHVAHLEHYGRDFSRLEGKTQRQIQREVQTAVETYSRCLEGFFTPIPAFRAAELEPGAEEFQS